MKLNNKFYFDISIVSNKSYEKYFDFSLYSHHFSLFSLTSLLSAPEREVTSPSDFKVVGDKMTKH
jgi:hypothetical protein